MKTKTFKHSKIAVLGTASILMGTLVTGVSQAGAMKADFNGDTFEDLAFAIPTEDIGNATNSGAVKIVYGRSDGRMENYSQTTYLHQRKYGAGGVDLYGAAETSDGFGNALAIGDFNNDGYDDLAIGVRNESIGSQQYGVGVVNIVYGSSNGLTQQNNHLLTLQRYKNGAYVQSGNYFGTALAVGDFDGDGVDDLAVSFLGGRIQYQGLRDGGAAIFFGVEGTGLKNAEYSAKTHLLMEPWSYIHYYNAFGQTLSSGDYNNDGIDDLAISAPEDKKNYWKNGVYQSLVAGSVSIALGVSDWNASPQSLTKVEPGNGTATNGGRFGQTMISGNLDSDGQDELAIAMPRAGVYNGQKGGVVRIHNFNKWDYIYYQSRNDIPGSSKTGDRFGEAMTIADFNDDGRKDLAIGVPGKSKSASFSDWNGMPQYGEVVVLYTSPTNLFYKASIFHQGTTGVEGGREDNDNFGSALSSGDFNNDGVVDLLVGVKYESIGNIRYTGVVQLIWGDNNGLTALKPGRQMFHQGSFSGAGFGSNENEWYDYVGKVLVP